MGETYSNDVTYMWFHNRFFRKLGRKMQKYKNKYETMGDFHQRKEKEREFGDLAARKKAEKDLIDYYKKISHGPHFQGCLNNNRNDVIKCILEERSDCKTEARMELFECIVAERPQDIVPIRYVKKFGSQKLKDM